MPSSSSSNKLAPFLLREKLLTTEVSLTGTYKQRQKVRKDLVDYVRGVGKSGDLDLILSIERHFLENDFTQYANSPAMANSLKTALAELGAAEKLVVKVRDPAAYALVDESHSLPKNRKGGVPRDEARQFFSSHAARLLNQDKSRLDAEEVPPQTRG